MYPYVFIPLKCPIRHHGFQAIAEKVLKTAYDTVVVSWVLNPLSPLENPSVAKTRIKPSPLATTITSFMECSNTPSKFFQVHSIGDISLPDDVAASIAWYVHFHSHLAKYIRPPI